MRFTLPILLCTLAACGGSADPAGAQNAQSTHKPQAPHAAPAKSAGRAAPATQGDFNAFWTRFQAAATSGNAAAIQALSAPTVLAHGTLDDDPVKHLSGANIARQVGAIVAANAPLDQSGRTIRTKTRFTPDELDGVGQQRIGDLVFKRGPHGWQLAEVYAEAE